MSTGSNQDTSTKTTPRKSARKYQILGLIVLLVLLGWSAFWYVSYSRTNALLDQIMAREVDGTPLFACEDRSLGGYPFRLLLTCSSFTATDPRTGWQMEGGPLRAIWQVYQPTLAVMETDAGVTVRQVESDLAFDMSAELLRGSVRFNSNARLERVSLETNMPSLASNDPRLAEFLGAVTASRISVHARPSPDNPTDLDIAFDATDFTTGRFPMVSGRVSFTARDAATPTVATSGNPARTWLQQSGMIDGIDAEMDMGQKTLKLNGDVAFDGEGRADGAMTLRILNPTPENARSSDELTATRDGLNGPLTTMQLMGKPVKDGDLVGSDVPITIKRGTVTIGILPVGTLPPIL